MSGSLLVIEDEATLAGIVADYAHAAGFEVQVIADGGVALAHLQRVLPGPHETSATATPPHGHAPAFMPDLIVLDLMLPGVDGLTLCRVIRQRSDVPIIMLTARVEEIDRLLGLELGADDYVCKPFSPRELMARVAAVLRRRRVPVPDTPRPWLQIDMARQRAVANDHALDLTPSEFALLSTLAQRPGVIFSRLQLLEIASRDNLETSDRAVDTHIKNLRRKLAEVLPGQELIHSVYGLGYRYEG